MTFFTSNNNAVLVDNCQNLQNLTVTLDVKQEMITLRDDGFSLQLNSYPQPTSYSQGQHLYWFQYIIYVGGTFDNELSWEIQYWANAKSYAPGQLWPPGYTPNPPNTTPWLPVLSNDDEATSFGPAPSSRLPAGSVMQIELSTDSSGNVTRATFKVTYPGGNVSNATFAFPQGATYPIYGFQVNIVAPGGGTSCLFTSGEGILTYSVSPGTLALQNASTGCGGNQPQTQEVSNVLYDDMKPASGAKVSQGLYVGQLFSYVDDGNPNNVFGPAIVGLGGWNSDFKFVFAGANLNGQGRIYAVTQTGELLSYGDHGTLANVAGATTVGFDGWSQFKFVFAGANKNGQNQIYAVNQAGLLASGDDGNAGNVSAKVISSENWSQFKFLFAGRNSAGQGRIYAVNQTTGHLLSYTDNGNASVSGPVTASTDDWLQFKFVFAGANFVGQNCIYAVNQTGQLFSYGIGVGDNVSNRVMVGFGGWTDFKFLFTGANLAGQNRIYAVVGS